MSPTRNLLQIDTVKVHLPTREVQRVRLNGNTDIFNNDEVRRYVNELDGRISAIAGDFVYKNLTYKFVLSYSTEAELEMGRVSVQKSGRQAITPEMRDEVYEFLESIYFQYFS